MAMMAMTTSSSISVKARTQRLHRHQIRMVVSLLTIPTNGGLAGSAFALPPRRSFLTPFQQRLRQDLLRHFHRLQRVAEVRARLLTGLDRINELPVLGLETAKHKGLAAAGHIARIVFAAYRVA